MSTHDLTPSQPSTPDESTTPAAVTGPDALTTPLAPVAPVMPAAPQDAPASGSMPTPATTPSSAPGAKTPARLRVGTVVWGLVLALIGIGVAAIGAGAALDVQAALIALLVVAGTALLVGAIVTTRRSSRT
jgi:hypothetical protein